MKLLKESESVFGNTETWKMMAWFLALLSLVTGFFSISVAVFTRRDFGERYLGWINLYCGYSVVAAFMFFGNLLSAFTRTGSSHLMTLFWLAFVGLSLYHRREITCRNNAGVEWHSYYLGTSWLEGKLPVSSERIYKILEPAAVFALGYFFWHISGQVGLWLMFGAVSLLINNHIVFFQERQSILNMRDAHIESRYFSVALAGRPARETAGFVVAESSIRLIGTDMRLSDAFNRLSDEMKSLLDTPPIADSGSVA